MSRLSYKIIMEGGPDSGNFGHSGRPGLVGGSGSGGGEKGKGPEGKVKIGSQSDFQTFKSGNEAEKVLGASASQWSEGDDYFDNKGVKNYAGTSDSWLINNCLRVDCGKRGLREKADALSETLDKAKFPMNLSVGRAINVKDIGEKESILSSFKSMVGKEFTDKAFVSTTANHKYVDTWSKNSKIEPIRCTVLVPKGAKAAYLPKSIVGRQEWEVLIQRGSKFRVKEVFGSNVVMEVV